MDDKPDTARARGLEALAVGLRLKRPGSVVRIIDEKPKISLREIIERVRLRCYCWSCGKETQRHNEHDTPECLDCRKALDCPDCGRMSALIPGYEPLCLGCAKLDGAPTAELYLRGLSEQENGKPLDEFEY
jgi:hypothetical protein